MDILRLFQHINDIVFEVLLWLVFLPKTMYTIVTRPGWISPYIQNELQKEEKHQFEENLSPVILMFFAAVMPFTLMSSKLYKDVGNPNLHIELIAPIISALIFVLPLFLATFKHLFLRLPLNKSELKKSFYIQCYCMGPSYLFSNVSALILFRSADKLSGGLTIFLALMPLAMIIWYLIAETIVIKHYLKSDGLKAFAYFILIYISSVISYLVLVLIVLLIIEY
jgi:hypothetical protein